MRISLFRNNQGFTLIEVLIALFLISFALLGLARYLQGSDRIQKHSEAVMEAALWGQEKISETMLLTEEELIQRVKAKGPSSSMQGEQRGFRWKVFLEEKYHKLLEIKVKIESDKLKSPLFFTTYMTLK